MLLRTDSWHKPACDADMKIWKAKLDELLDELKDTFTGRWHGAVRTPVKGVHDKVDGALIRECEHLFKTSCQNGDTRLLCAFQVLKLRSSLLYPPLVPASIAAPVSSLALCVPVYNGNDIRQTPS